MDHRNRVVFNHYDAKPVHIANLVVNCINEMRYYNLVSSLFGQDCNASIINKPSENIG